MNYFQTCRPSQISAVVENSGLNCQLIINYMQCNKECMKYQIIVRSFLFTVVALVISCKSHLSMIFCFCRLCTRQERPDGEPTSPGNSPEFCNVIGTPTPSTSYHQRSSTYDVSQEGEWVFCHIPISFVFKSIVLFWHVRKGVKFLYFQTEIMLIFPLYLTHYEFPLLNTNTHCLRIARVQKE